jgi:hypothetical protein
VSQVTTQLDDQRQYGLGPRIWSQAATGTGTATALPNESAVQMSTGGTASGAGMVRQTRLCWRYQTGKAQLIFRTFVFGAAVPNLRRRTGYFDDRNGVYCEQNENDIRLAIRDYTSGLAVDTRYATQAEWNRNKYPGFDATKGQLMFIDLTWLGLGKVRVGFWINGIPTIVHEFDNDNTLTTTYMQTANLPVRDEIENTGTTSGTNTFKTICCSVMSEGGNENFDAGHLNSASNGITPIALNTTLTPVLSIRPTATFGGVRNRAWYIPYSIDFLVTGNVDIAWQIVFGATLTGPTAFGLAFADSCVDVDVASTGYTGGVPVVRGYAPKGAASSSGVATATVAGRFPNSVDSLLGTQLGHTVVARSLSGTSAVVCAVNWRELT